MSGGGSSGGVRPARRRELGRVLLRIAVAIAAAIWALVFVGEWHRSEHESRFCASSCHHVPASGAAADFHARGHTGVPCQECHETSLGTGLRLVWATYTGSSSPVKHGQVTAKDCKGCHEKRPAEWRIVAATEGHRAHEDVAKVDCLSCHGAATHALESPGEKVCLGCHAEQRLHKSTTPNAETCLSCHSFAASGANVQQPTTVACARCHDNQRDLLASSGGAALPPMAPIDEHALHGGVACQLCHNAHGIQRKVPEGQPSCAACHKFENFQVGNELRNGPKGHRDCEGCHKPHLPRITALQRCVDCHAEKARGEIGGGVVAATTALQHDKCTSCHVPHTWKAERSGCMQCHKAETALLQTRSPPQHKTCTDCHEVHGAPATGAVCLKCHSDTKGRHVALAPERHKDCTSCHNPHAPLPQDTRTSCAKCHSNELTQVVRDGPEPHAANSCFTCHKPHDNPLPAPTVCGSCHADKAALVAAAAPQKHHVCASCHQPHVFRISDVAGACSRCHGGLFDASDKPFSHIPHQADCKTCHTFHGEPGVAQPRCLACHQDVAAAFRPPNPKHAVCSSCHQPHTPASTAPAQCATCHADKAAVAAAWPPQSAHAQKCNGCHQPHDVREKKTCNDCHAAEVASAMGGKHQCTQCHAPHKPPPGTGHAWWQRCGSCHAEKVASAKERGPVHSDCKNCHQPHKFAVPTCTSCHNDMGSHGLHAATKHAASCTSCHDPHVEAKPTREQCLACHTDKRGHEPNAKVCFTCHLFQ